MDPFGKFSPASVEYAQTAQRALSFQISYTGSNIPSFVQIDSDLLHGALKNGYLYRVVTVAYTKVSCPSPHAFILSHMSSPIQRKDATTAFTPSRPSDSFLAGLYLICKDLYIFLQDLSSVSWSGQVYITREVLERYENTTAQNWDCCWSFNTTHLFNIHVLCRYLASLSRKTPSCVLQTGIHDIQATTTTESKRVCL